MSKYREVMTIAAVVLVGCYAPDREECAVKCAADGLCPEGMTCSNGLCASPDRTCFSSTECAPDERQCASRALVEACDSRTRRWGTPDACSDDLPVCLAGECHACTPGTTRCADDGRFERCDDLAVWSTELEACPADQPNCVLGRCVPVVDVSVGDIHSCALRQGDAPRCWGDNTYGELGLEDTETQGDASGVPPVIPPVDLGGGDAVVRIAAGGAHTCAITRAGAVKCWGDNSVGQLGVGDRAARDPGETIASLVAVNLGFASLPADISAGARHTCVLFQNGDVACWGANELGQLGLGYRDQQNEDGWGKALIVDLGRDSAAIAISAGTNHTCAVLANGTVKCWGANDLGQLGLGDREDRGDEPGEMGDALPVVPLVQDRGALGVAAGFAHTCARLEDDRIECWGANTAGQLGLENRETRGDHAPWPDGGGVVNLGTARSALAIALGSNHTCALLDDGYLKCWGISERGTIGVIGHRGDNAGEMGDALAELPLGTLNGLPVKVRSVSAGFDFSCATLETDEIKCWGINDIGQLGLGDTLNRGRDPSELGDALPPVNLGD